MKIQTISNGNRTTYLNDFVFINKSSKSTIETPSSKTIYQGYVQVENDSPYINLIKNTDSKYTRKISIMEMKELPANIIDIEDDKIKITNMPIGTHIQIVDFPPFNERIYDTNLIIKDVKIDKTPYYIDLKEDEDEYDKEYIIWINNQCAKIRL